MKRLLIALVICAAPALKLCAKKRCSVTKITADDIFPFTIDKSGRYILCDNIEFNDPGTAITIAADNVQLSLNAHSIILSDASAIGIKVDGVKEVLIDNDAVENTIDKSFGTGIVIDKAQKVSLQKICTIGHSIGLLISDSCDVFVDTCSFIEASRAGCDLDGASSVTFENTVFNDSQVNLSVSPRSKDIKLHTCSFPNASQCNLLVKSGDGLLVKNCSFSITEDTGVSLVTIGEEGANNVRFECCTFVSNNNVSRLFEYLSGSGLKLDSCLFEATNSKGANLLELCRDVENVHIRGCTFKGSDTNRPAFGIDSSAKNVVIQDSLIQNMQTGIRISSTSTANTVRSCTVCDNDDYGIRLLNTSGAVLDSLICRNGKNGMEAGIDIGSAATLNVIKGNTISSNPNHGIFVSGDSNTIVDNEIVGNTENGIELVSGATDNTIQKNRLQANENGIVNAGTDNHIYFNTAHNNPTANYAGGGTVIPTTVTPGTDKDLEASNIDV